MSLEHQQRAIQNRLLVLVIAVGVIIAFCFWPSRANRPVREPQDTAVVQPSDSDGSKPATWMEWRFWFWNWGR